MLSSATSSQTYLLLHAGAPLFAVIVMCDVTHHYENEFCINSWINFSNDPENLGESPRPCKMHKQSFHFFLSADRYLQNRFWKKIQHDIFLMCRGSNKTSNMKNRKWNRRHKVNKTFLLVKKTIISDTRPPNTAAVIIEITRNLRFYYQAAFRRGDKNIRKSGTKSISQFLLLLSVH